MKNTKLILILFLILIILLLIYYIYNYNIYNNILLLKFVDYNNNEKIITKYPEKNYPDKYKIKLYNIKENIIPIPYNIIEDFTLCYGEKGKDGLEGSPGPRGKEEEDGLKGSPGPVGKPAVYKICNLCKDGEKGIQGEKGNLVKSVVFNTNNNTLKISYDDGKELVTGNIKGQKGDKGITPQKQAHHRGDRGPQGPIQWYIDANHNRKYLGYINIQTINLTDPWIYALTNNCVMFAMLNDDGKTRPAVLFKQGDRMEKLGFPHKKYDTDDHDGGDSTGIVTIKNRDSGSIKFRLHHSVGRQKKVGGNGRNSRNVRYVPKTMTVVSFWWN